MLFLDSHKGRIGRFKRIGIAMQMDGGRVRHEAAARAARLACAEVPPVGGTFQFQIFIQTPSLDIWSETISGEGGPGGEMGRPVFGLPPLGKNLSAAAARSWRGTGNGQ